MKLRKCRVAALKSGGLSVEDGILKTKVIKQVAIKSNDGDTFAYIYPYNTFDFDHSIYRYTDGSTYDLTFTDYYIGMTIVPPFYLIMNYNMEFKSVEALPKLSGATFSLMPMVTGIDNLAKTSFFAFADAVSKKYALLLIDIPDFIEEQIHFGGKGWVAFVSRS